MLCLATSLEDLRLRLGRIVVAYTATSAVTAGDLQAAGAMAVMLRDALAQPGPDPRGRTGLHPLRPVRQHRPRQQLGDRHPGGPRSATASSPRPASAPTWAPRTSSTSSAGSPASPRRGRARRHRAGAQGPRRVARRRRSAARTSTSRWRPGCPTCASTSRSSSALRPPAGRRHQPLPDRLRLRARGDPRLCDEMGVRAYPATHVAEGGAGARLARGVVEAAEGPPTSASSTRDLSLEKMSRPRHAGLRRRRHRVRAAGKAPSRSTSGSASATCRSSSPRPTCRSRPTPRAGAPTGQTVPCARCAPPSAPATSTRSAATCARCRGCRGSRPPSASTSPRRAPSPACRDGGGQRPLVGASGSPSTRRAIATSSR